MWLAGKGCSDDAEPNGCDQADLAGTFPKPFYLIPQMVPDYKYTEASVSRALMGSFKGFTALQQVRYSPWGPQADAAKVRKIDLLAVEATLNLKRIVVAFEVKTSRGDFLSDVRDTDKQAQWRSVSSGHYYVAPAGLLSVDEMPTGSGLAEVSRWRYPTKFDFDKVEILSSSTRSEPAELPTWLVQELLYRAGHSEVDRNPTVEIRNLSIDQAGVALTVARGRTEAVSAKLKTAQANVRAWERLGDSLALRCFDCGLPVTIRRGGADLVHKTSPPETCRKGPRLDAPSAPTTLF